MEYLKNELKTAFLVGIGGVSMSALAKYYLHSGIRVLGSDRVENERTRELTSLGVKVFLGHKKENVEGDFLVVTSAVLDNEELSFAKAQGIPILTRTEAWKEVMDSFYHTVGIAGSHGKTTATAMLAHVFFSGGESFTAHVGGEDKDFSNLVSTGRMVFLTEVCEYQKNLLKMIPETAVLLNIDPDHMECYRDETDLRDTFFRFLSGAKRQIVHESVLFDGAITFGLKRGDYCARSIKRHGKTYSFTVTEYGRELIRIRLKVPGIHNVLNALSAVAVARQFCILPKYIKKGLESFEGVKRRFEKIRTYRGAKIVADYAHHPREISSVLDLFDRRKEKLLVLFQPHTYSRTKLLFEDFVKAFEGVEPVIYETYAAREEYDEEGSARRLANEIKNSRYVENERELKSLFEREVKGNMTVLVLGAGDLYEIVMGLPCET